MSGFVVILGTSETENMERVLDRIRHRGPHVSGFFSGAETVMAQNYLRADCPEADTGSAVVPVVQGANGRDLRICYDGQIGNMRKLAGSAGVSEGPFQEERLLLQLYSKRGVEMLQDLNDAIFAFVIADENEVLAARDVFGIKTLFYGRANGTVYLTSELKSLVEVTDDVHEFPPGHFMDRTGTVKRFADLPEQPPDPLKEGPESIASEVRQIIDRSVRSRVDFARPTACLLSGGMDSSAITYLVSKLNRECGSTAPLRTYAVGAAGSGDLPSARIVAEHVGSDHKELLLDLDGALEVLPEVIYALESFDPSLVRSTVSNFLISRQAARDGYEVLLSGEGGDEMFCGYEYLKNSPEEELFARQMECFRFLHNNASLRLDRANLCNSIRIVAPLISGELFNYALRIPPKYKQRQVGDKKVEKWIFRKAFEQDLPKVIIERLKQEFSQGSGVARLLPGHFDTVYSDAELAEAQAEHPVVRSKEELYYFRLFTERFGSGRAVETVGQWPYL